jgi:hypothetical protein
VAGQPQMGINQPIPERETLDEIYIAGEGTDF